MTRHEQILAALEHCLKVFCSMSDRGAYPQELLPWDLQDFKKTSPLYLGEQGYKFLLEAIKREREEGAAIQESRL